MTTLKQVNMDDASLSPQYKNSQFNLGYAYANGLASSSNSILFPVDDTHDYMNTDRVIGKLHSNLDSRYLIPINLQIEFRKTANPNKSKRTTLPTRSCLTQRYSSLDKQVAQLEKVPLTPPHLMDIIEQSDTLDIPNQIRLGRSFCHQFFRRYCNSISNMEVTKKENPKSSTKLHKIPHGTDSATQRNLLCPLFFPNSLFEAVNLCERPVGRPWPAVLLYLHHEDSPYTETFVTSILCSKTEEFPRCSENSGDREPNLRGHKSSTLDAKHRLPDTIQIPTSKPIVRLPSDIVIQEKMSTGSISPLNISPVEERLCEMNYATIDPDSMDQELLISGEVQSNSNLNHLRSEALIQTSPVDSDPISIVDHMDMSQNAFFHESINKSKIVESISSTDNSQDENEINFRDNKLELKTFRSLLWERSAGLVPWDCTTPKARAFLASAFAGTRLTQWLSEWISPENYPVLVAVGRTAEGDVVCSQFKSQNATLPEALNWLNKVTLAHFQNYRQYTKPMCPERGEILIETNQIHPKLPPESPLSGPSIIQDHLQQQQQTIPSKSGCEIKEASKELTVDKASNGTVIVTDLATKKFQQQCLQNTSFRVIRNSSKLQANLSSIFELPIEEEKEQYRNNLKNIQQSFQMANTALAKSITYKTLSKIGIIFERKGGSWFSNERKCVSIARLIEMLCYLDMPNQIPPKHSGKSVGRKKCPKAESTPQAEFPHNPDTGNQVGKSYAEQQEITFKPNQCSKKSSNQSNRIFNQVVEKYSILGAQNRCKTIKLLPTKPIDFYNYLSYHFIGDLPSTPPFLIGSLFSAILRCLDVTKSQQVRPLLIYLHDSRAPGALHFMSNILCSKRFTAKLYECSVFIWPFDVTSRIEVKQMVQHPQPENVLRHIQSPFIFPENSSNAFIRKESSICSHRFQKKSESIRSSDTQDMQTKCTHRRILNSGSTKSVRHQINATINNNASQDNIPYVTDHSNADLLIECFADQPAGKTLESMLAISLLPAIVNLHWQETAYRVTSILVPSFTTKQAVAWLSLLLKSYKL